MPPTIELVGRGPITLEEALIAEKNIVNLASYRSAHDLFDQELWGQRDSIQTLVKRHLALGSQSMCIVLPPEHWTRGGFNVCVLVEVQCGNVSKKVTFRCPMPHKVAEARYPGSAHEKLSTEVGAYIWVEENCPEIRSPHLFGFGTSDGRHFTHTDHMSFFTRLARQFWRHVYRVLQRPLLSKYIRHRLPCQMSSAYMILEWLGPDTGQMLSTTFHTYRDNKDYRARLFRGMSRTMLSLARIPQQRIGSFQFHDDGTITLTNRPLSCSTMILENDGAPRTMQRDETLSCTDAYASDLLTFHDRRFLSQPHAAHDESDCRAQMAAKALLRVESHNHIRRELRDGPFVLQLTDFHASNILVDEQWNITGLIDLEWICALPAEMLSVPYWLTGCSIDGIEDEKYDQYDEVRREFMEIFTEEEEAAQGRTQHGISLSNIMRDMWDSKGVWFWHCLSSINAMYFLPESHLLPPDFLTLEAESIVSRLWCRDSEDVVRRKIADKQAYDDELRKLFGS
ncbi:uncharacterized protein F5Z01DRAFT_681780 [Emericellopsis atlantica]|uniref:Aminoglycoside phosphotransferase domain-containing protein n=1 Tax=Emericellopsis atlantica TaxID=2614577 RepID=A0A9P7ZKK7_9HYPO|nr:uncharacterized protein F5Z01DRAFT_681780 [Emericellopsis atlantica]KAG9253824.1 hypothetical protein F5Z01DRAFT_681780 [Emericellopsis atlantica]